MILAAPKAAAYEPAKLNERHEQILRMALAGMSKKDIAESLSITPVAVGYVLDCELGRQRMEEMKLAADIEAVDLHERIQKLCPKAIDVHEKIISGEIECSAALKLKAANDVLGMGGFGKVTRIEADINYGYLVQHGIDEIKKRARALDADYKIIDREYSYAEEIRAVREEDQAETHARIECLADLHKENGAEASS